MNAIQRITSGAADASNPTAYEALRQRHVRTMLERLPTHFNRLTWRTEQLRAERDRQLRELVHFACEYSPWHRKRLSHLDADALSEDNLDQLPTMTKDDLMGNFDEIVTDPRLRLDIVESHLAGLTSDAYLFDRYHAIASGGSCGRRGVFVWDWEAWVDLYLGVCRLVLRERSRSSGSMGRPIVQAGVGADHPTHASSSLFQTFSNPGLTHHAFPVTLSLEQIVSGLNRVQPDFLLGYPSLLHALAREAGEDRLRISPQLVASGAEPLLPETRILLQDTWHVPVINMWASSEGATAVGCGHGPHMHLSDDLQIVEPVDVQGHAVRPSVRSSKIYLTNLYNRVLPLIRYEITDEVTQLEEACPCGSSHRLIADVQGRLDDSFMYQGIGTLHPHRFRSRLSRERNIIEYQVSQTTRGATVKIRCRGSLDLEGLRTDLIEELARFGLTRPEVSVSVVEGLQRHAASGKLKRFLPLTD